MPVFPRSRGGLPRGAGLGWFAGLAWTSGRRKLITSVISRSKVRTDRLSLLGTFKKPPSSVG